jgi:adenine-specific DNA-methyltransferase
MTTPDQGFKPTPRNIIVNADCTQFLPTLPGNCVDFILTDPPYGVSYQSRDGRTVPNDDNFQWLQPASREMFRVLRPDSFCVSFYGFNATGRFQQAFRTAGFKIVGNLVFAKRYRSSARYVQRQHECAFLLAKGNPPLPAQPIPDVLYMNYSGNKLHPTQKPVSPLMMLVNAFCPEGGLVLDPFAGSGSSLLAAHVAGRGYIGVELDANYHAIASRRLQHHAGKRLAYVGARQYGAGCDEFPMTLTTHKNGREVREKNPSQHAA